jgi:hypothetical protein
MKNKMMKRKFSTTFACLLGLFCCLSLTGCKDVFEEDITNKTIMINTPKDSAQMTVYNQLFWWNKVEGATDYSIQIVSPSFDSLVYFITDTLVSGVEKFNKTLAPGTYQWRIKALNGAYETKFQTYTLFMLAAPLAMQEVLLKTPANNSCQNTASFALTWEKVPGAKQYRVLVDSTNGNFVDLMANVLTTNNYINITAVKKGTYYWKVKAMDDIDTTDATNYSDPFNFCYKTTVPLTPAPSSPSNGASFAELTARSTGIAYGWGSVNGAAKYSLMVYTDTLAGPVYTYSVTSTTSTQKISTAASGQTYYWRVSAIDKASNESTPSAPARKFTITQ